MWVLKKMLLDLVIWFFYLNKCHQKTNQNRESALKVDSKLAGCEHRKTV